MCRKRGARSAELPDIGAPAVLDAACKSDGFAGRCSNPRVECKYQHLRLFCRSMRYDQCWPRGEEAFGAVRQSFARAAACRSMPITRHEKCRNENDNPDHSRRFVPHDLPQLHAAKRVYGETDYNAPQIRQSTRFIANRLRPRNRQNGILSVKCGRPGVRGTNRFRAGMTAQA